MKKKYNFWIYCLLLALVASLQGFGIFDSAEYSVSDRFYQDGERVSNYIYIIGIDEETLSRYGAFDTWGRDKIADLINLLNEDEKYAPAVIAIDVGYFGNKDAEIDAKLVEAVKNAGNVVLTETATFGNVAGVGNQVVLYEEPFEELKKAAYACGHANVQLDSDGVARHAAGNIYYNSKSIESFDIEIYKAYLQSKGESFNENSPGYFGLDPNGFYINYSGTPRAYYGSVGAGCSLWKVLEGEYPAKAFKNAVVFIGAYASGMQDNYYSAIDKENQMYGVEIHANIVNQLIDGIYKKELSRTEKLIPTIALGILVILIVTFLKPKFALPINVALEGLYVFGAKLGFSKLDIILPILAPVIAVILITIVYFGISYYLTHKEKQRIIANYGKYLSPEVAKHIADIGEDSLSLGGIKKDIAVLFVDIRGFTPLSESLLPEQVFEMLNSYLQVTTTAIFNNEGTVDKFIGDATMGVFNAPLDLDDYTYKAVCAGLDMAELGKGLDDKLPENLKGRVGFGVGINCGDAVVGNVGTDFRMEYTAIGDTVNTASRLEGQAKAGEVILSDNVYQRVKDRIECVDAGKVKLKGKSEEVQIYRAIRKIGVEK